MPSEATREVGSMWSLLAIFIEIAVLVALGLVTRYTILHRSGLREPDRLHRIWSKAPEIRYQPIENVMIFAVFTSFGAQTVIFSFVTALCSIVGLADEHSVILGAIFMILSTGISAALAVLIYRAGGGKDGRMGYLASYAFNIAMYYLLAIDLGFFYRPANGFHVSFASIIIYILLPPALIIGAQTPFAIWALHRKLPATARKMYNEGIVPNWVKLDRSILVAAAPLMVFHVIGLSIQNYIGSETYLSRVASSLSILMLLSISTITSIISVNRALLANEFQWQWRAFLTPAIPLGVLDFVILSARTIFGKYHFVRFLYQLPHLTLSYGSCGVLGAYIYLLLAERYVRNHVDFDDEAQTDLLNDYEVDEDNEELDI